MKLTSYVQALTLFLASVCVTFAVPSTCSGQTQSDSDQSKVTGSAGLVTQSGFSGGIVVALDFSDRQTVADIQAEGNSVVHGLFTTEASVEKARREIAQAGR